jgi:large subunit ribosomal protein L25
MAEIILNVEVRAQTGTGGARAARRGGMVPGILYGGAKDPVAIAVKSNEFRKALYTGKLLGHLVTLKYGEETQPVIAKAVDMHPVTDEPWHFDLYRVGEHQQIKIDIPVHFANQEICPGLKRGGNLSVIFHSLNISCPADQIPEEVVIDLAGLEIGDSVRVSDVKLPAGITATLDGDLVVASIAGSRTGETDAADGEAEG